MRVVCGGWNSKRNKSRQILELSVNKQQTETRAKFRKRNLWKELSSQNWKASSGKGGTQSHTRELERGAHFLEGFPSAQIYRTHIPGRVRPAGVRGLPLGWWTAGHPDQQSSSTETSSPKGNRSCRRVGWWLAKKRNFHCSEFWKRSSAVNKNAFCWRCSSVLGHLPAVCQALGSRYSTGKKNVLYSIC